MTKFPTHIRRGVFWRFRQSTSISRKLIGRSGRADYGKALIACLAKDLSLRHGKGFSRSNLVYMRLLYLRYPISQKPSHQLSWSHYVELLKIDD